MSKSTALDRPLQKLLEQQYLATMGPISGGVKHALKKVTIATLEAPDCICGVAQRVGYTGRGEGDLAIYRLKIRHPTGRMPITLSGFFVLQQGIFHEYHLSHGAEDGAAEQQLLD